MHNLHYAANRNTAGVSQSSVFS